MSKQKPTDFTIVSAPSHITFDCPHCGSKVQIPWRDLLPPECWSDAWDDVTCPECLEEVELGEYDYD